MNTLKRFSLIVTLLILTACSMLPVPTATPQPTANAELATLAQNRQKWDALKTKHYQFKLAVGCFCGFRDQMPLSIEVKDGKAVSMLDSNGKSVDQFAEPFDTYNTVEKLFDKLNEALNGGADKTTVEYNLESGYPQSIYIDYKTNVSDDEINFTITDFQIIK